MYDVQGSKQLNLIGSMKKFMKPNCNLCMQERLTMQKKLRNKRVTVMNKNSEIYWACRHKMTFHLFCLSTDDPAHCKVNLVTTYILT